MPLYTLVIVDKWITFYPGKDIEVKTCEEDNNVDTDENDEAKRKAEAMAYKKSVDEG